MIDAVEHDTAHTYRNIPAKQLATVILCLGTTLCVCTRSRWARTPVRATLVRLAHDRVTWARYVLPDGALDTTRFEICIAVHALLEHCLSAIVHVLLQIKLTFVKLVDRSRRARRTIWAKHVARTSSGRIRAFDHIAFPASPINRWVRSTIVLLQVATFGWLVKSRRASATIWAALITRASSILVWVRTRYMIAIIANCAGVCQLQELASVYRQDLSSESTPPSKMYSRRRCRG